MATSHPRRPWGTARNTVPAYYRIDPETKDHLSAIAKRLGISVSELMERVIHEIPLTLDGVPTWWEPSGDEDRDQQGKLNFSGLRSDGQHDSKPPASGGESRARDSRRMRLAG